MSNFKNWTPVIYVNTTYPYITAPNLNKNEVALTKTNSELNSYNSTCLKDFIDYAMNNSIKEINNFENTTDFSTTGSMMLAGMYESSIFGANALKIQDLNDSGGSIGIYDTFTSIDLTAFPSGASSSSSDYIMFAFYVSDSSKFNNILIRLGDDDSNCYYKFITSFHSSWNVEKMKKSDFGTDGTPSGWDDVTFLRIYVDTKANASSDYVACNKLWLCRKESGGTTSSPLYVTDGAGTYDSYMYLQGMDDLVAYYDKKVCKKGIHNANDPWSADMLQVMSNVNAFSFKCEMYAKLDEYPGSLLWYIDSYNYILVEPILDDLRIVECVDGSQSIIATVALEDFIYIHDRLELWVEKTADNIIRARLEVDGLKPVYAETTISIPSSNSGDLGIIANFWGSQYFVTDFVACSNPSLPLPAFNRSLEKLVIKHYDQSIVVSTILEDDDELYIKLPSNTLFEIELVLIYTSTSAIPDIKVAWSVSGDYTTFSDGRVTLGAAIIATSHTDIPLYMNNYILASAVRLGHDSSGELPYYEKILMKTGESGCKLQLQWAQNTSNAAYTRVKKGSYIKATRL